VPTSAPLLHEWDRPSRPHFVVLAMCWAGWLFDFYDLILFSFLLVPIRATLGVSNATLSLLLGASLGATALGGLVFGRLADRFGRKPILGWTILVYSLGTFLCAFAPSAAWLLCFRIVTGFGVGGEWATGQALIAETFPARMRGRYAAVMQSGAPLGVALASLVGGFLAPAIAHRFGPEWGWRGAFMVSVLPALLVVAIRRVMPESDVWLRERSAAHAARVSDERDAPRARGAFAELMADPRLRRAFLLCFVLAMAGLSAYWFTYLWLPTYLYEKLGFSMAKSSVWVLITQAGGMLGYLSFGWFADTYGRRGTFSAYCAIWAVGLAAVTLFWNRIAGSPGVALSCMFLVGVGTGIFSGYGPVFSEMFPTRVRNTAMGSALNLARGVQFFAPLVITGIAAKHGLGGGIGIGTIFLVIAGLWIWTLPETRGRSIVASETT
jgi:MFS family permease